ncbi:MAG: SMI1/KNR4 family protein [Planctomycetota bacterium]
MDGDKIAKQINAAWDKLEKWFHRNASETLEALPAGATESDVEGFQASIESRIGGPLPPEVRASYFRHDGTGEFGLSPSSDEQEMGYALIPIADLPDHLEAWDGQREADGKVSAGRGIQKQVWNQRWLPIATNGAGDYHLIDLDPAKGGKVGQIIEANHETLERKKVAPSFLRLLQSLGNQLREGELLLDEDLGICLPATNNGPTPEEKMQRVKQILAETANLPQGQPPEPGSFVTKLGYEQAVASFGAGHFRHPPQAMNEIWQHLPTHAAMWTYFYSTYDPLPEAKVNGVRLLSIREMIEQSEPIILSAYAYLVAESDDGMSFYADHLDWDVTEPKAPILRLPSKVMAQAVAKGWTDKKLRRGTVKVAADISDFCEKIATGTLKK